MEKYLDESIKGLSLKNLGRDSRNVIPGEILKVFSDIIPGG